MQDYERDTNYFDTKWCEFQTEALDILKNLFPCISFEGENNDG